MPDSLYDATDKQAKDAMVARSNSDSQKHSNEAVDTTSDSSDKLRVS